MPVLVDNALDWRKVFIVCGGEGCTWVRDFDSVLQKGLSGHICCLPPLTGGVSAGVSSGEEFLLDLPHC